MEREEENGNGRVLCTGGVRWHMWGAESLRVPGVLWEGDGGREIVLDRCLEERGETCL